MTPVALASSSIIRSWKKGSGLEKSDGGNRGVQHSHWPQPKEKLNRRTLRPQRWRIADLDPNCPPFVLCDLGVLLVRFSVFRFERREKILRGSRDNWIGNHHAK